MRRLLIAIAAFVVSAVIGVILLLLVGLGVSSIQIAIAQHNHPGLGAVAGGLSEASVLLVPILCGVIGTMFILRRVKPEKP